MEKLPKDYILLRELKKKIDAYFKKCIATDVARSNDIYDYIHKKEPFKKEFQTAKGFSRFLRRNHDDGVLTQIIPNCAVDTSNPHFYQWRFYPLDIPPKDQLKIDNDYMKSYKLEYRGCLFHSILELKFALLIEEKCSFLREPISIFYDPDSLIPTSFIGNSTRKYTPDFLVRKWSDNTTYLIEIKPSIFMDDQEVEHKKSVAENFINTMHLDWKYKILSENKIILNDQQKEKMNMIIKYNKNFLRKLEMQKLDRKYNNSEVNYFSSVPTIASKEVTKEDYVKYVKFGKAN